jgi:hypothetical protein
VEDALDNDEECLLSEVIPRRPLTVNVQSSIVCQHLTCLVGSGRSSHRVFLNPADSVVHSGRAVPLRWPKLTEDYPGIVPGKAGYYPMAETWM